MPSEVGTGGQAPSAKSQEGDDALARTDWPITAVNPQREDRGINASPPRAIHAAHSLGQIEFSWVKRNKPAKLDEQSVHFEISILPWLIEAC